MANPLSDRGVSDRDYAAAVGTLVGEAGVGAGLQDFQAIADVIANRMDDPAFSAQYGSSIASQTMRPNEFSAWSPREDHAYRNAMAGYAAALSPTRAAAFSPAIQNRVELAKQAVNDVFNTGVARGLTQGATFYDNPDVTASLGTGGFHNRLSNQFGSVQIGQHRFTGPNFQPDKPFDPVTYNGMLDAPPAADAFFGDLGIPTGQVASLGPVPDLSPSFVSSINPATANFSDVYAPDLMDGPFSSSIAPPNAGVSSLFGAASLGPPQGLTSPDAASLFGQGPLGTSQTFSPSGGFSFEGFNAPDMIDRASFNDRFDAGFPGASVSMDYAPDAPMGVGPVGALGMGQAFGVEADPWGASGFHAGLGEDPYSGMGPDFAAPSFEAEQNMAAQFGRASGYAQGLGMQTGPFSNAAIADRINAELGPQPTNDIRETQKEVDQLTGALLDNEAQMGAFNSRVAGSPALQNFDATPFGVRDQGLTEISPMGAFGLTGPQPGPSQTWAGAGLPSTYTPHDYAGTYSLAPAPAVADVPAYNAHPASLPSLDAPISIPDAPHIAQGPDYGSLVGSAFGAGKPMGGFMDAMANPALAAGYGQPAASSLGPFGWNDKTGLTIGGFASPMEALGITGSIPKAQTPQRPHGLGLGNLFGGFDLGGLFGGGGNGLGGAMVPNGTGGWRAADALDAMSNPDVASRLRGGGFSLGGLFGGLANAFGGGGGGGGYYGGGNNGPNSSLGDGSYADQAGYSDNNPQGIL